MCGIIEDPGRVQADLFLLCYAGMWYGMVWFRGVFLDVEVSLGQSFGYDLSSYVFGGGMDAFGYD